jgi:hypothetical protein
MEPSDLESHLPVLLRHTVADMPVDTQLEQRVRQIVQDRPRVPRHRPGLAGIIAVALVAVLAIAGFVWLRPAPSSSSATHSRATDKGITIVIDKAYADASQTIVVCHFTSTAYQLSQLSVLLAASQVHDGEGNVYDGMFGTDAANRAEQSYTPLPRVLLMQPQALTLVVREVDLTPLVVGGGVNITEVTGLWQVPFVVTPIAPVVHAYQVPPVSHDGVTVQPVSLETFTGQHPFDMNSNEGAGARLILRIGGLSTPDALHSADLFDSDSQTGGSSGGGHLTFNGQVPSYINILPGSVLGDSEEIEILYWVPLRFSGSTAQLNIDRIRTGSPATYATGPWSFDLPVS